MPPSAQKILHFLVFPIIKKKKKERKKEKKKVYSNKPQTQRKQRTNIFYITNIIEGLSLSHNIRMFGVDLLITPPQFSWKLLKISKKSNLPSSNYYCIKQFLWKLSHKQNTCFLHQIYIFTHSIYVPFPSEKQKWTFFLTKVWKQEYRVFSGIVLSASAADLSSRTPLQTIWPRWFVIAVPVADTLYNEVL